VLAKANIEEVLRKRHVTEKIDEEKKKKKKKIEKFTEVINKLPLKEECLVH